MLSPFPDVIRIESSGRCNFRCIHCPTGTVPNKRPVLTREKYHLILDQFAANHFIPRVVVLYHGGESLLNVDLEYFIVTLKRLGVKKTVITTNGSMLTEARSTNIIEAGLDCLKVSFDGSSPEENDLIRQNGKFTRDVENVKTLLRIRKRLGRKNPDVIISNIRICDKTILDRLNERGNFVFPRPPEYLTKYFLDELPSVEFQSYPAMVWPGYTELRDFQVVTYPSEKPRYCGSLFETTTILSNGDVVPCCYDLQGEEVFGNVFKTDVFSIWRGEMYESFRENFRNCKYSAICDKCNVVSPRYLCKK